MQKNTRTVYALLLLAFIIVLSIILLSSNPMHRSAYPTELLTFNPTIATFIEQTRVSKPSTMEATVNQ